MNTKVETLSECMLRKVWVLERVNQIRTQGVKNTVFESDKNESNQHESDLHETDSHGSDKDQGT